MSFALFAVSRKFFLCIAEFGEDITAHLRRVRSIIIILRHYIVSIAVVRRLLAAPVLTAHVLLVFVQDGLHLLHAVTANAGFCLDEQVLDAMLDGSATT